ncbi:TPA: hypothetical protein ACSWPD_003527 [Escherichia coli]
MKKLFLFSAIALGMLNGIAHAGLTDTDKEIQFVGAVSKGNCDVNPVVDGSGSMMPGVIQLGVVKTGTDGTAVKFRFKPTSTTDNLAECDKIEDSDKVYVTWTSGAFNGTSGLGAISGSATDAVVYIKATNAESTSKDKVIITSGTSHEFLGKLIKSSGDGLQYTAQLHGGTALGDIHTAAKFNVIYK